MKQFSRTSLFDVREETDFLEPFFSEGISKSGGHLENFLDIYDHKAWDGNLFDEFS